MPQTYSVERITKYQQPIPAIEQSKRIVHVQSPVTNPYTEKTQVNSISKSGSLIQEA